MSTMDRITGMILDRLDYPANMITNPGRVAEAGIAVIDIKVTEANLSRYPWYLAKTPIHVHPNEPVYNLDSITPGFDKVRYLYTQDQSDITHQRRYVELVPYESLTTWHQGGIPAGSSAVKHTAVAAATYFDVNKGNQLEFGPIPQTSADYVLIYEPATARPQTNQDTAFRFEQFEGYIADCGALKLLNRCQWDGDSAAKRKELAGGPGYGLVADVAKGDLLFWKWVHSGRNPSGVESVGWAMDRW